MLHCHIAVKAVLRWFVMSTHLLELPKNTRLSVCWRVPTGTSLALTSCTMSVVGKEGFFLHLYSAHQ